MFKYYRPTGNHISLKQSELNFFSDSSFKFSLYQSGTAALSAAIKACINLRGGNTRENFEIIIPAYACPDLISAIIFAGVKPVLVDLAPDSLHIDHKSIKQHISHNTLGIIVVNFLGLTDNLNAIRSICSKNDIFFIHDCAQWFPTKPQNNIWAGDFNIISFGRGKPVNLLHGGAVVTCNEHLHQTLTVAAENEYPVHELTARFKIMLYNLLIKPYIYRIIVALPGLHLGETRYKPLTGIYRMNNFFIRLLSSNIQKYSHQESPIKLIHQRIEKISHPYVKNLVSTEVVSNHTRLLRYPLLITNQTLRDTFFQKTQHLGTSTLYPSPLNKIPGLEQILDPQSEFPQAMKLSQQIITFPTHEDVDRSIIEKIIDQLELLLRQY